MIPEKNRYRVTWLSHPLNNKTPQYGGGEGFRCVDDKSIARGDSCNTSQLSLSNHIGSHVDAPNHFIEDGFTIDAYGPEEWIFYNPIVLEADVTPGEIIEMKDISFPKKDADTESVDMVLIHSGFDKYRGQEKYWKDGPGLAPDLVQGIRKRFPSTKAVGIDMISISSLHHRNVGRAAHKAFLSCNIRLIEDLTFKALKNWKKLKHVVVLPLRISDINGAPCTVIGWENIE